MKQKYQIVKDDKQLKILEYAELDKDTMSLLCEQSYPLDKVIASASQGREILISTLRTRNMYPLGTYAVRIAEAVETMLETDSDEPVELIFDDIDLVIRDREIAEAAEALEAADAEIDDLLEDEVDDGFTEKMDIAKLKSSIRVADDEPADIDDDS